MKNTDIQNQNNEAIATLALVDITRERDFQVRYKLDKGTVGAYMSSYRNRAQMPPVKVAKINGAYILLDGFHRIAALELLNEYQVKAEVVATTKEEALWIAASANLLHGLPLKSNEYRNVLKMFIKSGRHIDGNGRLKSYREFAEELGNHKAYTTIRNWIRKDFPKLYKAMQKKHAEPFDKYKGSGHGKHGEINFEETAMGHINNLKNACRAISDEKERKAIVDELRKLAEQLECGEIPLSPTLDELSSDF